MRLARNDWPISLSYTHKDKTHTHHTHTPILLSSLALYFSLSCVLLVRRNLSSNLCSSLSLSIAELCLSIAPFYSLHAFCPPIISRHLFLHSAIFYTISLFLHIVLLRHFYLTSFFEQLLSPSPAVSFLRLKALA